MSIADVAAQLARLNGYNSGPIGPSNPLGLAADGHQTNFPQALKDLVAVTEEVGAFSAVMASNEAALYQAFLAAIQPARAQLQTDFAVRQNSMYIERWVSPTGNDNAAGTLAAPLATISGALAHCPFGGIVIVNLTADYVLPAPTSVNDRRVLIRSHGARRTLSFAARPSGQSSDYAHFYLERDAGLFFADVTILVPAGGQAGYYQSPIEAGKGSALSAAISKVGFEIVTITLQTNSPALVDPGFGVQLSANGVTSNLSMAGRWLTGVAAGTATHTLPLVMSNLTTL